MGFNSDADHWVGPDVETAEFDQIVVHHRIEVGIVDHVVDVAVEVVVGPTRLHRLIIVVVGTLGRVLRAHLNALVADAAVGHGTRAQNYRGPPIRQPPV